MTNRITMEINISLNHLINATPDAFTNYIEEAAIEDGLLAPEAEILNVQYDLLRHEGNELWLDVTFEVAPV